MLITYRELEDFLVEIHEVAHDKRTAMKGRLKHFQRLGWPAGTNMGKGARVNYGIGQTMSLAMGLEMLQLGLTPERVVEQLGRFGGNLADGFAEALSMYGFELDSIYYIFDPKSLNSLRDQDNQFNRGEAISLIISRSKLEQRLSIVSGFWGRRFALINMTEILDNYISYFIGKGLAAPDNLVEPLVNWQAVEAKKSEDRLNALMAKADGDT